MAFCLGKKQIKKIKSVTEVLITIVDAFNILNNDIKTLPLCTGNEKNPQVPTS